MASRIREILTDGGSHLEERRTKTLVRSLFVLDQWIEKNEEHTDDEVRIRRIKRWREEALEELRFHLGLARR
jgi:hypothetical protein